MQFAFDDPRCGCGRGHLCCFDFPPCFPLCFPIDFAHNTLLSAAFFLAFDFPRGAFRITVCTCQLLNSLICCWKHLLLAISAWFFSNLVWFYFSFLEGNTQHDMDNDCGRASGVDFPIFPLRFLTVLAHDAFDVCCAAAFPQTQCWERPRKSFEHKLFRGGIFKREIKKLKGKWKEIKE